MRHIRHRLGSEASKSDLRRALRSLEQNGAVVRRRGNRWETACAGAAARQWTGRLQLTAHGGVAREEEGERRAVFIRASDLHLALDGDLVRVELAGRTSPAHAKDRWPRGRIVCVIERAREEVVGLLQRTAYHWYVIPDDPRIPWNVSVRSFQNVRPQEGRKVVARLEPWTAERRTLGGVVIGDLGEANAAETRRRALYRRHGLNPLYEDDVRRDAAHAPREPGADDFAGRMDLRNALTLTIDPADAHDFDDAVSLQAHADGGWQLDVHIADVGHYVPMRSAIDREARDRGTSVYLVGEAVPMLPPDLTSEVCSLQPDRDRLCLTVRLAIAPDGTVVSDDVFPSIIRSRARLSYEYVQSVIPDTSEKETDDVTAMLRNMHRLALRLRTRRLQAGALDLAMPEVQLKIGADGEVTAIRPRGCDEAYHLIEEFMLLANSAMARRLSRAGVPALYRVHEAPDEEQWEQMDADLSEMGLSLRGRDREAIRDMLAAVKGTAQEYPASLAVLRNLKRAVYSAHRSEHFGLATEYYTHFTSPIRRYPDLIVHRQWRALACGAKPPYASADLRHLAEHCSRREHEADEAEAESLIEKRIVYYANRMREGKAGPYEAIVTGTHTKGVWVELRESLQRGLVREHVDASARGRRGTKKWRPGDTLWVEIVRVDERRKWVDFRPCR